MKIWNWGHVDVKFMWKVQLKKQLVSNTRETLMQIKGLPDSVFTEIAVHGKMGAGA